MANIFNAHWPQDIGTYSVAPLSMASLVARSKKVLLCPLYPFTKVPQSVLRHMYAPSVA